MTKLRVELLNFCDAVYISSFTG